MIQLRNYRSYRTYLKDIFEYQKKNDSRTTLSTFSKALKLSTSGLQMTMSGSRNLTVHKIHEVAFGLKLTPDEHRYFESLVHYTQATSRKEKSFYGKSLSVLPEEKVTKTLRLTRKEILSEWYLPAFLLYLIDQAFNPETSEFEIDYKLVERRFSLSKEQANQLLETLMKLGALDIRRDDKAHIVFDKVGGFLTNQPYMLKVLDETGKRIKRNYNDPGSYFEAHTLTITEESFVQLVADYKSLLHKYISSPSISQDKEHIYQTFMSIFPAT